MQRFEINGAIYDIPTDYSEMTIEEYCGLYKVLEKHTEIDNDNSEVTEHQTLMFYFDLFKHFTGLDDKVVSRIPTDDVTAFVNSLSGLYQPYNAKGILSFQFEGETYNFPQKLFKDETFGSYIESAQLDLNTKFLAHRRFDVLPEQMAILCRKPFEPYSDEIVEIRKEAFKKLTMDVVFEFAFFLTKKMKHLDNALQMSLLMVEAEKAE
jgi:hypothetical protein